MGAPTGTLLRPTPDAATAASSASSTRLRSTVLRLSTQRECTLPRLALVSPAASCAAPVTTLESTTARCAAPTGTLLRPTPDAATAASSASSTRLRSTVLRPSTQRECTLPRLACTELTDHG